MKSEFFAAAAILALSATGASAGVDAFKYSSPADMAAGLKGQPSPASTFFTKHDDFQGIEAARDKTGQVETHQKLTDYIVIVEGAGKITIGGTVKGNKQTAPGELRGDSAAGGKDYALVPGAVIIIPAGTAHWMQLPAGGHLRYITMKWSG